MSGPPSPFNPLSMALHLLGDAWSVLILDALLEGPERFGGMWTSIHPIRPNTLSARLKRLEQCGMIRRELAVRPYGVTYSLARNRYEIGAVLAAMKTFGHVPWEQLRHERRMQHRQRQEAPPRGEPGPDPGGPGSLSGSPTRR